MTRNIIIAALSVSTAVLAYLLFLTDRELGICIQLLAQGVSAVSVGDMNWSWLVPVLLFAPFVGLLVSMFVEDWQSKKWEDRE